jgi:ABC-type bacteriocin/lantibiotic exporter with double-glycine peptidase domain
MLSRYFHTPFRKDVIRRVLEDNLQRTGSISLPLCGAVGELMGLNSQLIDLPATSLVNINPPALIRWNDSLALLYEINSRQATIAVPARGHPPQSGQEYPPRTLRPIMVLAFCQETQASFTGSFYRLLFRTTIRPRQSLDDSGDY